MVKKFVFWFLLNIFRFVKKNWRSSMSLLVFNFLENWFCLLVNCSSLWTIFKLLLLHKYIFNRWENIFTSTTLICIKHMRCFWINQYCLRVKVMMYILKVYFVPWINILFPWYKYVYDFFRLFVPSFS